MTKITRSACATAYGGVMSLRVAAFLLMLCCAATACSEARSFKSADPRRAAACADLNEANKTANIQTEVDWLESSGLNASHGCRTDIAPDPWLSNSAPQEGTSAQAVRATQRQEQRLLGVVTLLSPTVYPFRQRSTSSVRDTSTLEFGLNTHAGYLLQAHAHRPTWRLADRRHRLSQLQ